MLNGNLSSLLRYASHPIEIGRNIRRWRNTETVDLPLVLVLGPPRSGTTLLHRTLLNHSRIAGFSEETSIISPKSIYDFNRFAHFVDEDAYRTALDNTRSLAGFFAALHKYALPAGDLAYYAEKTPQHAKRLDYILSRFPNVRIVFAVRDGRDTYCSGKAAGNIPQARTIRSHAAYFMACVRPAMTESARRQDQICVVRYEDFTIDPSGQLDRIMGFLGVDAEPEAQLSAAARKSDDRALRAEFARLNAPISGETVGRWRREMTGTEATAYARIAGSGLSHFGYEI